MKAIRGGYHPFQNDHRLEHTVFDSYTEDLKPMGPARCPDCNASYVRGRWSWKRAPVDALVQLCPACQRIRDDFPAGYVKLKGPFLKANREEILGLLRAREKHENAEHPLQRIMGIRDTAEGLEVTTTDSHLARMIAGALRDAYDGELTLRAARGENLVRATWKR